MPVHESHKQSDLEKRLQILRQSLNVAEPRSKKNQSKEATTNMYQLNKDSSTIVSSSKAYLSDSLYLKQDLIKIIIFTLIAFATQAGLFFALQNNLLKIPSF
jgi:hypothetical protein